MRARWSVPIVWGTEIDAWTRTLTAAGKSRQTVGLRRYHLRRLGAHVGPPPWEVTEDDLAAWVDSQDWGRETRRSTAASYRAFWAWGMRTGRTTTDPTLVLGSVRPMPPNPHPAPDDAYLDALADAGPREALMLRLAAELGMRRGEVAQVHARDVIGSWGRYSLVVHGKGGRERTLPMGDGLALAVRDAAAGGWCFPGKVDGHLGAARVGKVVSRLLPPGVSMHSLRHRFASEAYAVDRDIVAVQELLGHASLDTTRRYVLSPDDDRRRLVLAVSQRPLPPRRRDLSVAS
ncbi:site-specific integrase [Georgenia sp. TF02-10]|uniref:tyrosine-type recombinase/integrase n=1 Tax=Georgenia sp. TF02-10 TaxID=2917725 RepID=UPI001FA76E62|nr:site-specific integrase [Georgenia sp. TF02-10]UNX54062.1 site-specific integrase [Georgenia sp. TF02-10]